MALVLLLVGAALSAPSSARQTALINAFSDRKTVESIVDCFLGKKKCSPEEEKMRGEDDLHEGKSENLFIYCEEKKVDWLSLMHGEKRERLYLYGDK